MAVHPLTASSKAAPANAPANRWVVLPRSITRPAYSVALRPDYGEAIARVCERAVIRAEARRAMVMSACAPTANHGNPALSIA